MALQDRLDAFKADFVSGRWLRTPSQEVLDIMQRGTAELIATGQAQRARKGRRSQLRNLPSKTLTAGRCRRAN